MFGIGGFELAIIMVFALLVFGPDKLPEIGRTVGRAMRQFQDIQDDMTRVVKAEMYSKDSNKSDSVFKPTKSAESVLSDSEETIVEKIPVKEASGEQKVRNNSIARSLYDLDDDDESTTENGQEDGEIISK